MRGISKIVSTIALLAMVVAGISAVWHVFSGNISAYSSASIMVSVEGTYNGTHAILKITIRNTGGSAAKIVSVSIDNVNITEDIISSLNDSSGYLASGACIQKVVVRDNIKPGNHILKITYEERGVKKETYVAFTI